MVLLRIAAVLPVIAACSVPAQVPDVEESRPHAVACATPENASAPVAPAEEPTDVSAGTAPATSLPDGEDVSAAIERADAVVAQVDRSLGKATRSIEVEGEDATSATATILWTRNGVTIKRRTVWNGGALSAAQVTDEYFSGEELVRRELAVAPRGRWAKLASGADASDALVVVSETFADARLVAARRDAIVAP